MYKVIIVEFNSLQFNITNIRRSKPTFKNKIDLTKIVRSIGLFLIHHLRVVRSPSKTER